VVSEVEQQEKPSRFAQLRAQHEWLDHLVRAGTRYTERHGDHYAAAITYFSVLSLVPLILVGFAIAGYVLFFNPALLTELQQGISKNLPPGLGTLINPVIDNAIRNRGTIGIIGLLGGLYSGVGWMTNLREALSEQWAQVPATPPMLRRLLVDLLTLLGLGIALVASFAITGIASGFTRAILDLLGLSGQAWAEVLLGVVGFVLGLFANWLIFLWVIARLPREHVTLRSAARAAGLGALGFEVLKQVMTVYLGVVTNSPAGALLGPFIGLLVFVFFASRYVLFVTAWAATARENEHAAEVAVPGPATIRSEVVVHSGPSRGAAAGLLGAGALSGVLGTVLLLGRRR
jgi:membrane protein